MSEVDPQQRKEIVAYVDEQLSWLNKAAEVVDGPGAQAIKTFSPPVVEGNVVRDSAPDPGWTDEQEVTIREIARPHGYSADQNMQSGLKGGTRLNEGGLVWKIMAETNAVAQEDDPHTEVFLGSPYRTLSQDREMPFLREQPEVAKFLSDRGVTLPDVMTEYDLGFLLARMKVAQGKKPGSKLEPVIVEEFGYAKSEGNSASEMATGQLLRIGHTATERRIDLLRVEGELYVEVGDDGKARIKEKNRPNIGKIIGLRVEYAEMHGLDTGSIAPATSATYISRKPATILAGLQQGIVTGDVFYGRQELRELGAPVPKEMPRHQIQGDLYMYTHNLMKLSEYIGHS